ncbi:VOC family protein [Enterococcus montenegrensis]|uniref:VOC family protein n=1 Tax=Enterococcus montenegrensis TaxID=3031993 RepID=UPI00249E76BC|nr:VOC family protein [Enterococcus montenegrensis]WHA09262.1 VOC family protein [Enterococcus montenegrensis]
MNLNGLQHIGIPTQDFAASQKFYESLGFQLINKEQNGNKKVGFFDLAGTVIEVWEDKAQKKRGAIDHIALDTKDIATAFTEIQALGYPLIDNEIMLLPFWEKGISYFNFIGPNGEIIEISQIEK